MIEVHVGIPAVAGGANVERILPQWFYFKFNFFVSHSSISLDISSGAGKRSKASVATLKTIPIRARVGSSKGSIPDGLM